ncbi:MAG: YggT family protein [Actinomycetota bacterium]
MICTVNPVIRLLCLALTVYWLVLLARVIVSWIELAGVRPPVTGPLRTLFELLFDVTEPVLRPIRRIVPPAGPLDLSVIVAFVIIFVLQNALC